MNSIAGTEDKVLWLNYDDGTDPGKGWTLSGYDNPEYDEGTEIYTVQSDTSKAPSPITISNNAAFVTLGTTLYAIGDYQPPERHTPKLSDPSPSDGSSVSPSEAGVELSINVSDADLSSGDQVTVSFYDFETGDKVGEVQTTQNTTASVTWDVHSSGTHGWYAIAQDSTGKSKSTDVFTIEIDSAPHVTSASPSDDEVVNEETVTLQAQISDSEFPNDTVNVSFYNAENESLIGSQVISDAGVASTTWNVGGGRHGWYVKAEDSKNQTSVSSVYTFGTPGRLVFRRSSDTKLINQTEVNVEMQAPGGFSYSGSTTSGYFNFSELGTYPDKEAVVDVRADGYFNTSLSVADFTRSSTVYLTEGNASSGLPITFKLNDKTGMFPASESTLTIKKPLGNGEMGTVKSSSFGAANTLGVHLSKGQRYQLEIENAQGDTRSLGNFRPVQPGTYTLPVGRVNYTIEEGETYAVDAYIENNAIKFEYADPTNKTKKLDVNIYERGNETNSIYQNTWEVAPGENMTPKQASAMLSESQRKKTWVVDWERTPVQGDTEGGQIVLGAQKGSSPPIPDEWQHRISIIFLLLIAAIFGGSLAEAGALITSFFAGILWYIDWLPPTMGVGIIVASIIIAVLWMLGKRGLE
ncbi:MAG: hypothetical protein SV253_08180 [Halobacteria archaeon]|nr:hypothetical protein [Halobacteria archaeon]